MPIEIRPYMTSIRKKELKEKKKKTTTASAGGGPKKTKKDKQKEEEVPSDDDDDDWDFDDTAKSAKAPKSDETFILQNPADDGVVDLLDPRSAMQNIVSTKPKTNKNQLIGSLRSKAKEDYFKRMTDGRFVFDERMALDDEEEEKEGKEKEGKRRELTDKQKKLLRSNKRLPVDAKLVMEEEKALDKLMMAKGKKALTKEDYLDQVMDLDGPSASDDEETPKKKNHFENSSYAAKLKKRKAAADQNNFGKKYKAAKAGGDIKIGKYDPFAYIPLDPKLLNKRKKHKAVNALKAVVAKPTKRAHKHKK